MHTERTRKTATPDTSDVETTSHLPVIRLSLHCDFAQLSHSVFSTGLCVCATVDRLRSVPGRTVGLSELQLSLRIPDRQFGMCVPFQTFYQGLPILRLVVVGREQFGVYGSSEVQPGFYQLSCKG
ncbi:hypothetical protein T07_8130 [Trichinella nelsoni]|uniref:Uncharacterized protein n=1 Tax=Trichinella nelsoni TaxID=6336 RepID=A0A0V0RU24_9BILA|nr:hypothetical protein T07_8130 [Trichinella nelsoni]